MKYAITGHTYGLGLKLVNTSPIKDNYIGFSRSTGHNINDTKSLDEIVELAKNCDVFINNAYSKHGQTDLLYKIWDKWYDKDKIIVNIGSSITDGIKSFPYDYIAHKASLDKASKQLSNQSAKCKVILARFGYLGTPGILKKDPVPDYIDLNDAVEYILYAISVCKKYKFNDFTIIPKE
jgi:hypothetical protein